MAEDYKAQLRIAPDSTLTRFRNAAIEGYKSMIDGMMSLALVVLSYGPSLLLWGGLLFLPLRFLWRKWRLLERRFRSGFRLHQSALAPGDPGRTPSTLW